MSESQPQEKKTIRTKTLHGRPAYEGRWRFILLFLVINLLIFVLIWLSWQNQKLVREITILTTRVDSQGKHIVKIETQVAVAEAQASECEVDCTDRMSTVAAVQRTRIAQMTATIGSLVTRSPIAGTPTGPPVQTATPAPTLAPTSSPTGTPAPPTPTPTPTSTPTTEPKPSTPEHRHPPEVLDITPAATVRSVGGPTFPVTITGNHFAKEVTACLGANIEIADITSVSDTTITGTLLPSMSVGIYGLTVTNLNDPEHPDTLSPAFTVYSDSLTILESPYVVTFGRDAGGGQNELPYQLIFFEVPEVPTATYYVHIFDADTGGSVDEYGDDGGYSTAMTYTVYGGTGAYTAPGARAVPPPTAGITSGTVISTVTIGRNDDLNLRWGYTPTNTITQPVFLGPFSMSKGEKVGNRRIFKLVVEGGTGDDGNWYRVALSTRPDTNTVPYEYDARIFAFSWAGLVHRVRQSNLHLHPYVTNTMTVTLRSWGCESKDEQLWVRTPFRNLTTTCLIEGGAGVGAFTPGNFDAGDEERGMTWAIDLKDYTAGAEAQSILFWAEDGGGIALPIFTRPTTATLTLMPPSFNSAYAP